MRLVSIRVNVGRWGVLAAVLAAGLVSLSGSPPLRAQSHQPSQTVDPKTIDPKTEGAGAGAIRRAHRDPESSRVSSNPSWPAFGVHDEIAALEAVRVALTEVGDGSSYVWYRNGGRLSGVVQPTRAFEDTLGRICRHLVVTLSAAGRSSRTNTIACRLPDGTWTLDG